MNEALQIIIFFILAVALIVGAMFGVSQAVEKLHFEECIKLGETINYPTRYVMDACWINVKDNLWIEENDILQYLPFLLNENGN